MTWVDQSSLFGFGSVLTSTQMQNLRDNLTAVANGDPNSPVVQGASKTLLKKVTHTSSTAYFEFTGMLNTSFDQYELSYYDMQSGPNETAVAAVHMKLQYSNDSGSTYFTTSPFYPTYQEDVAINDNDVGARIGIVAESSAQMTPGMVTLFNPNNTLGKKITLSKNVRTAVSVIATDSAYPRTDRYACVTSISDYDSFRILCGTGDLTHYFTNGSILLYGINTNSY